MQPGVEAVDAWRTGHSLDELRVSQGREISALLAAGVMRRLALRSRPLERFSVVSPRVIGVFSEDGDFGADVLRLDAS